MYNLVLILFRYIGMLYTCSSVESFSLISLYVLGGVFSVSVRREVGRDIPWKGFSLDCEELDCFFFSLASFLKSIRLFTLQPKFTCYTRSRIVSSISTSSYGFRNYYCFYTTALESSNEILCSLCCENLYCAIFDPKSC